MKSFYLFLLSVLFCISDVIAQDKGYKVGWYGPVNQHPIVEVNKQTSDTVSLVRSSFFYSTQKNSSYRDKDDVACHLALMVERYRSHSPEYFLNLSVASTRFGSLSIVKDSPLLIKLSDDSVIRLNCKDAAVDEVGELISARYHVVCYKVYPLYPISPEDIDKLAKGIKKIRFEVNAEKKDLSFYRYKKDEVGNFLYQAKSVITDALNKQTGFEEGF